MKQIRSAIFTAVIPLIVILPFGPAQQARKGSQDRGIENRDTILDIAKKYIGVPYVFGGSSPRGFDCSGYTQYVFNRAGYQLPHSARRQHSMLKKVATLHKGDLVFYRTYTPNVSHVGIYVGDGKFLHAPRSGKRVSYTDMKYKYWRQRYAGARSVIGVTGIEKPVSADEPVKKTEPIKKIEPVKKVDPAKKTQPEPKFEPKFEPKKTPQKKEPDQELLDFELIGSIYSGNEKIFDKFLNMGANPSVVYRGWSVLMLAVDFNQKSMVQKLIVKGAKVNYRSEQGWNALALADYRNHPELARILLDAGAVRTRMYGKRPEFTPRSTDIEKELF